MKPPSSTMPDGLEQTKDPGGIFFVTSANLNRICPALVEAERDNDLKHPELDRMSKRASRYEMFELPLRR